MLDLWQIIFGNTKNHCNRLKLRNNNQGGCAVGLDNIAGVYHANPNAAIYRLCNVAVSKVQPRVFNLPLVVLYRTLIMQDTLFLVVELLLVDCVPAISRLIAIQIDLGFLQYGLSVCKLSLCLSQLRFIWPRVDH